MRVDCMINLQARTKEILENLKNKTLKIDLLS